MKKLSLWILGDFLLIHLIFVLINKYFSDVETDIGLTEYISLMAQPAWTWREPWDFPRLYSWNSEARDEIMKLFNYNNDALFRGLIELHEPNFENFSLPTICDNEENEILTNYCKMLKTLPSLQTTMDLMFLATFPLNINDNLSNNFKTFKRSNQPLPSLSLIPTCFFSKEASKYWKARDFGLVDTYNNLPPEDFKKMIMEDHQLPNSDIYRYPSCKQFTASPTENGICHTFNSADLADVLKDTQWRKTFFKSFDVDHSPSYLKSEGIDMEDGFIFSLDTLQSMLITMKDRAFEQANLNTFWIKVHQQGEIPWMKKDKSTWKKIEANSLDMSTKFITLKGEQIKSKTGFREIPQDLRKCFFPDEGNLELFDYYTESNCQLECAWRKAHDVCGCKPWHVPAKDGTQMCFVLGNLCFDQIMTKIEDGLIDLECDCEKDCVSSRYTMSLRDKTVLERTSTRVFFDGAYGVDYIKFGTDKMDGSDYSDSDWYNMGEYLKDLNFTLLPQEPLLDIKFPRPIMERGYCGGIWDSLEASWEPKEKYLMRDCDPELTDYPSPFARKSSKVHSFLINGEMIGNFLLSECLDRQANQHF